jgi:PAS domain S-box-containing protein
MDRHDQRECAAAGRHRASRRDAGVPFATSAEPSFRSVVRAALGAPASRRLARRRPAAARAQRTGTATITPMSDAYHWNPFALPWAVVAVALFALAAVIYRRQRASRVAVLFCAMIALVGVWFLGFMAMLLAVRPALAELWGRVALSGVSLLPATMYAFTTTALRLPANRRDVLRVLWLFSFAFLGATWFGRGIIDGVSSHSWGWYPIAGRLAPLFIVLYMGALFVHLLEGLADYRRSTDAKRKRRVARLMTGFIVVYAATIDFIPMFVANFPPVGFIPVMAFIIFGWGSIRRHRFQPITAARATREILETMADALFVLDAEGKIRVVNGAVTTLLGFKGNELLGRSIDTLEPVDEDVTITRTLAEITRRGPIRDQERVFRARDGRHVDVSVSISPVSEEDVERGAVVIARDIRTRKRTEAELRAAIHHLQQSNRELEDFAHIASHDLQEPLRKIQAFGELLDSKHAASLPPQARDYIERMRSAAKRMQVLINDLLAFSRVATKAQPFAPVDLAAVAREVAHDLELRVHEAGGHIDIGEFPVIDADPLQMRQLLQNLVGNALKFQRDDVPPVVTIGATVEDGMCRINVADNGIGFDEKYADRIFTMFERLHGRGKYEGTGIGLAICRRIAERHGGTIVAHSTPGEGSTFIITLPVKQGEEPDERLWETDRHPVSG